MSSSLKLKDQNMKEMQWLEITCNSEGFVIFRERRSSFSLDLRPFGQSVLDGVRSKVTLRGKGYAWAPIWWNSDNSKR